MIIMLLYYTIVWVTTYYTGTLRHIAYYTVQTVRPPMYDIMLYIHIHTIYLCSGFVTIHRYIVVY